MAEDNKVIFWDFDGTLVFMQNGWRAALMDVLNENEPGHDVDPELLRPWLKNGFPWHQPQVPHTHLKTADEWWRALEPAFLRCYQGVGYSSKRAIELASVVREQITRPERYKLYEDAVTVLADLRTKGWRHVILSNHVPELAEIVNHLGLSTYIDGCISSGNTGYEKPNPQAFCIALKMAGNPKRAWMVGDNIESDIKGAEAAGISAIQVHTPRSPETKHYSETLSDLLQIVADSI